MDNNFSIEAFDLVTELEKCFRLREEIPVLYSEDKGLAVYLDSLIQAEEKRIWEQINVLFKEDKRR